MAEDGIPEILAEPRLGHQVPGIRGLYAHSSDRMRKTALQTRWEESLRARAALSPTRTAGSASERGPAAARQLVFARSVSRNGLYQVARQQTVDDRVAALAAVPDEHVRAQAPLLAEPASRGDPLRGDVLRVGGQLNAGKA
jgi:hypothetical protein